MLNQVPEELESVLEEVCRRFSEGPESPLEKARVITPTHFCWFYCCVGALPHREMRPVVAAVTVLQPRINTNFWFVRLQVWGSGLLYRQLYTALQALEEQTHQKYVLVDFQDSPSFSLN